MELRPLGPDDRAHLETFRCATAGALYTLEVEQEIQEHLAGYIQSGVVEAVGLWDGDDLVAIASFKRLWVWKVDLIATALEHRQRKHAYRLLRHLLQLAEADPAAMAVAFRVHLGNAPMLNLAAKVGAFIDPQEDEGEYRLCTVPV